MRRMYLELKGKSCFGTRCGMRSIRFSLSGTQRNKNLLGVKLGRLLLQGEKEIFIEDSAPDSIRGNERQAYHEVLIGVCNQIAIMASSDPLNPQFSFVIEVDESDYGNLYGRIIEGGEFTWCPYRFAVKKDFLPYVNGGEEGRANLRNFLENENCANSDTIFISKNPYEVLEPVLDIFEDFDNDVYYKDIKLV